MQEQLQVWQDKLESFDTLQEQHSRLRDEHKSAEKEAQLMRKQVCVMFPLKFEAGRTITTSSCLLTHR
jgi:hypothetical protein